MAGWKTSFHALSPGQRRYQSRGSFGRCCGQECPRAGATLPSAVETIPNAIIHLRQVLNPKKGDALNRLENILAGIDLSRKRLIAERLRARTGR